MANVTVAGVQFLRAPRLKVAPQKTDAIFIHEVEKGATQANIRIGDAKVSVEPYMKHRGLILDDIWELKRHFELLASRMDRIALSRPEY